ncbi:MAG: hypothetical protein JST75_09220 [Bacteroidetes bacterium]|nr:hypothetical protein [Bacteroidota bacterium]
MKNAVCFFIFTMTILTGNCQSDTQKADQNKIENTPAKSGFSYQALTQFFQTTVSSGSSGGYDFKATLFGIEKLFAKKDLNSSEIYLNAMKIPRRLEFGLGLHRANTGSVSLVTAGIKYAIWNAREKSETNFLEQNNGELGAKLSLILKARDSAIKLFLIAHSGDADKMKQYESAAISFHKSENIKDFPDEIRNKYDEILIAFGEDPENILSSAQDLYDKIAKEIDKNGLLTVSFNPSYNWNGRSFDSTSISLRYLKGFGNYKKPWNFDLVASESLFPDTFLVKKNLERSIIMLTLGLDKTLLCDSKLNPVVEFGILGEIDYIASNLRNDEKRSQFKIVNTLIIHISKEISLPIVLKYDLAHPNLFGVFSLQWNLKK